LGYTHKIDDAQSEAKNMSLDAILRANNMAPSRPNAVELEAVMKAHPKPKARRKYMPADRLARKG
jgi:hypothetical protein